MGKLEGKAAVITGGASGIGEATVRRFVAEGAGVVIADIDQRRGKPLAEELGPKAVFHLTDVSQEAQVKEAVARAVAEFGRLDCMFNNAGVEGVAGGIEEIPVEAFDQTMGVLLRGVFLGMKHAAPVMKKQGSGSIINTSSVAGLRPGVGPHVYNAAKAAVINLTRSVAMELGESGVRVNCICPGAIATAIFARAAGMEGEAAQETVAGLLPLLAKLQPIPRAGLPQDIANAALWLAGDEASFITGQALTVDGGMTGGWKWSDVREKQALLRRAIGAEPAEKT